MGCPSCRKTRRITYGGTQQGSPIEPPVPENLSAAKLTPHGWTKTCIVCGSISEPAPFAASVVSPCSCAYKS